MAKHAKLSPSSAETWMVCPGSVILSEGLPEVTSKAANEGTAAHFLGSESLLNGVNAIIYLGRTISLCRDNQNEGEETCVWDCKDYARYEVYDSFIVSKEMADYVQVYVDLVRQHATGGELFVETALSLEHLTSEKDAKGTTDACIVKDDELIIVDLKYGQGNPVSAIDNHQLKIYALAAYHEHSIFTEFKTVRMIISQPRIFDDPSEHVMSVTDLLTFAEEVKTAARRALSVCKDEKGLVWDIQLSPGEKQRKWCKAKLVNCQKFTQSTQIMVMEQFEVLPAEVAEIPKAQLSGKVDAVLKAYSPEQLNAMKNALPLVKQWCKAVEETVDFFMIDNNGELPDYKVVQANEGSRQWVNPVAAEAELKRMKVKEDNLYDRKLISPPKAEKLYKEKILGERQWSRLQQHITRPAGGKTVVYKSDPRPALTHVADQFEVVVENSEPQTAQADVDISEFL